MVKIPDSLKQFKKLKFKNTWIFSDNIVTNNLLTLFTIIILIIYNKKQLKCKRKSYNFLLGYMLSDLISGLFHWIVIDDGLDISGNVKLIEKEKYILLKCPYGYSSHHHLYPSGWYLISDKNILNSTFILSFPLILHGLKYNHNDVLYYTLTQLFLITYIHKYTHERNHGRYVPWILKIGQNLGIFLSPKKHKIHHEKSEKGFGFYHGHTDFITNAFIKLMRKLFNLKGTDTLIKKSKQYQKKFNTDIIKFKLVSNYNDNSIIVNRKLKGSNLYSCNHIFL